MRLSRATMSPVPPGQPYLSRVRNTPIDLDRCHTRQYQLYSSQAAFKDFLTIIYSQVHEQRRLLARGIQRLFYMVTAPSTSDPAPQPIGI